MKSSRVVIVQCRLSSTRLPGKALMKLNGRPVLGWALAAMKKVEADYYYVATDQASYKSILPVCEEFGFKCFPGSADDVLKRFCDLLDCIDDENKGKGDARGNVETVIRATADNPFLFYEAASDSADDFEKINQAGEKCDYLTYSGLPHGSGVEIFSASSIRKAITETDDPYDHEHVGPALYKHQDRYVCKFIKAPEKYNYPELRTTIDTYSDYLRALNIASYISSLAPIDSTSENNCCCEKGPYKTEEIIKSCFSQKVRKPFILVPSVKKGQGTGHLRRCFSVALNNNYFVYIPENKTLEECDSLVDIYISKGFNREFIINKLPDESYKPVFITDCFKLSRNDYKELSVNNGIVSIDEGSDFTQCSDYLLDIIPSYGLDRMANKTDYNLIEKPNNRKSKSDRNKINTKKDVKNILVSLGGEDPENFTLPVVSVLKEYFTEAEITATGVDTEKSGLNDDHVFFVKQINDLKEKLYKYDIVVTHYGLTAFESAYAGCGVILLPTTELHRKLAEKYNFDFIQKKDFSLFDIEKAFKSEKLYPDFYKDENCNSGESLSSVVKEFLSGRKMCCPICQDNDTFNDKIISRNDTRTYRRCSKCGMAYMSYTIQPEMHYEKSYFFEDYKKQYGKTYEEDFQSIKAQGLRRVNNIKKIAGNVCDKTLLDIGCAYGPFLAASADNNIIPFGTDISDDAVAYVQNTLKYNAKCCPFPDIDTEKEFGEKQFDIISMWYVIEHFQNLDSVLKKVNEILKTGGIFAFSTPCGEGISGKSDIDHFYQISPADHYSIWEITKAEKILRKYGFEIKKIVSTGHHPERFPIVKKNNCEKGSLLWKTVDRISRIKRLGDTVEIYCKKIN